MPEAAVADARRAEFAFDDARAWLDVVRREPFAAEVRVTLSLSYAVVGVDVPLAGESGQPPRWVGLDEEWASVFPEDRDRIRAYVRRLTAGRAG